MLVHTNSTLELAPTFQVSQAPSTETPRIPTCSPQYYHVWLCHLRAGSCRGGPESWIWYYQVEHHYMKGQAENSTWLGQHTEPRDQRCR